MAETFRKALVEVLVPEIRELREETRAGFADVRKEISGLRGEVSGLRGSVDELGRGQDRLETLFEQHLKSSPPAA